MASCTSTEMKMFDEKKINVFDHSCNLSSLKGDSRGLFLVKRSRRDRGRYRVKDCIASSFFQHGK